MRTKRFGVLAACALALLLAQAPSQPGLGGLGTSPSQQQPGLGTTPTPPGYTGRQPGLGAQPTPGQPGSLMQPRPGLVQPQPGQQPTVGQQTGRLSPLAPAPGADLTGRAGTPGCNQPGLGTGRGAGQVCQPAGQLPSTAMPYPQPRPPSRLGPVSPTGPQPGQYPTTSPPYGSESAGVPPPYGPGLGDGRVGSGG